MEVGEEGIIYLSLHCHHQNYFCIKVGSDERHFNVSAGSDEQSHKTLPTNHNLSEEAVSNRGPSAYQPNALPLGQTGSQGMREERREQYSGRKERVERGWAEGLRGEGRVGAGVELSRPLEWWMWVGAWVDEGGSHKPCPQSVKSLHRYCTGWPKIILCLKHNASPPSLFVLPHRASAAV